MCGIYNNPYEIARSLTVAAAEKVVINQAGKTIAECNMELGKQLALVYKTILHELEHEDDELHDHLHVHGDHDHSHPHTHDHGHDHDHQH